MCFDLTRAGPWQIQKTNPLIKDMEFHVGAWITNKCFVSGRRDDDGCFTLRMPVDDAIHKDALVLQVYAIMKDPESELVKPFPLAGSIACLRGLCAGTKQDIEFKDPNSSTTEDPQDAPTVAKMTLQAVRPLHAPGLKPSTLRRVAEYNKKLNWLANRVVNTVCASEWQVPSVVKGYINGLSYMPNGGSVALGIPPVQTHFAAYGRFIDGVDRVLPHAVLAYYLQMVLTQHGLTIREANSLSGKEFAKLGGSVLWGLTNDADGCPYQYDRGLAMGLAFDSDFHLGYGLVPVTVEDIGMPFAQSTFIGRDLTPLPRPDLRAALEETDARKRLKTLIALLHSESWEPRCRALLQDDCETSTTAGMIAKRTVVTQDMSAKAFRRGAAGYNALANWTDECFQHASVFFTRLQGMLRAGTLSISTVVGLAGGAEASQGPLEKRKSGQSSIDELKDLGGHCFAVLRFMDTEAETEAEGLYVTLLEGTTCMRTYHDRPDGPKYTMRMGISGKTENVRAIPMSQSLSLLCNTVSAETQVVNWVVGGPQSVLGIPGKTVAGFVRPTMIMPCLHSLDHSSPCGCDVPFYKWCVYTGMTGEQADLGIVPIDELEYKKKDLLGAGCRPAVLAESKLRGLTLELDETDVKEGSDILDEVWPPMADGATFKALLNLWETLPPLKDVNERLGRFKREGVSYSTLSCMESPASPAIVGVMYEINKALVDEANRINLARPDSDGVFLALDQIGTGIVKTLHAPQVSQNLTFHRSLREAKTNLGWPEPPPKPCPGPPNPQIGGGRA